MGNFLVGVDVGTSGTKAIVMNEDGKVYGSHYITYKLITPRPGWAEHDPEDYWRAVAGTIRESIRQAKIKPEEVKGVSISALAAACILVDKDLKPLQNGHIWMDRRGTAEAQFIREKLGDERVFQVSGNPIDPYYAAVKLLWEKNNRPELYKKAYKLQTAADYPCMKLTGKAVTDYSNASLIGIGYDIVNKKWKEEMFEEIGLDVDKLPDSFPCDEVIGEVTREAAAETGLAPGTPVVAGTVDATAAWAAGGATEDGDMSISMGTAGCMGFIHSKPTFTRNMITIVHTVDSRNMYTTCAATCAFGSVTRYFRDTFGEMELLKEKESGMDAYQLLSDQAEKTPVGSDGLITLPYFMGERTPIWDPVARGMVFGWSLTHTKAHLLRSFMEGAVYAVRHNFETVKASGVEMHEPLILCEGGAVNPFWRQMMSDIIGIQTGYMKDLKGAPFGNAVAAGVGTGIYKDYSMLKEKAEISELHEPDPERRAIYDKLYPLFRSLYEDVKHEFPVLAEVTGYK